MGLEIVFMTLVWVFCIMWLYQASYALFEKVSGVYARDGELGKKIMLSVPWLALFAWCLLLDLVMMVITLVGLATIANATRDWWHKGAKK